MFVRERLYLKAIYADNGCIHFGGALGSGGYGNIRFRSVACKAHRVAYELEHGPIPKGVMVLHKCDNPSCINVEHLFLGDQFDNMQDMTAKGRHADVAGANNGNARLKEEDVLAILKLLEGGMPQADIAYRYGVAQTTISNINRSGWKRLKEAV